MKSNLDGKVGTTNGGMSDPQLRQPTIEHLMSTQNASTNTSPAIIAESMLEMPFIDPIELLKKIKTAKILEEIQSLGCCSPERMYIVYAEDKEYGKGELTKLFMCKDSSTCCQHYFCCTNCREFNMDIICKRIKFDSVLKRYSTEWFPFIKLSRSYSCICSAFPPLSVDYIQNGKNIRLGLIRDWDTCCTYGFKVYEGSIRVPRYMVRGSCCQCGILCSCSCCKEAIFYIYDCRQDNIKIGKILKVWKEACNKDLTNVNEYSIEFPLITTWQQKLLLIACMLFIEFRHYKNMHR